MNPEDREKENRGMYLISVVMAHKADPMSYDEIFQSVTEVASSIRDRADINEELPKFKNVNGNKNSTYRRVFQKLRDLGRIGRYNPNNIITKGSNQKKDQYQLSKRGVSQLVKPADSVDGLSEEFCQIVQSEVYNESAKNSILK